MIEFLVATTDRTSVEFIHTLFSNVDLDDCCVLIVNQCINIPVPSRMPLVHPNVRVVSTDDVGTSVSRNLALKLAVGDVCTFTDDDLIYEPSVLQIVTDAFQNYQDDIITFQTAYIGSGTPLKRYRGSTFRHGRISALRTGDWEIFFRRHSVVHQIDLDTRFGLGCRYPAGEYQIFLTDALRTGLRLRYVPALIVRHPDVLSTGQKFDPVIERARGASFARMFGYPGFLACLYFAYKKRPLYVHHHSFATEVRALCGGFMEFMKSATRP